MLGFGAMKTILLLICSNLGEHVRWNHVVSFLFIVGAVVFGFWAKL